MFYVSVASPLAYITSSLHLSTNRVERLAEPGAVSVVSIWVTETHQTPHRINLFGNIDFFYVFIS